MSNFQGYVPYTLPKKRTKSSILSVIAIILFFIFLMVVFACLVCFRKVEKCYEKQTFYVVYVAKNKRKIDSDNIELIKKLGGAGSLLFFKEEYHLVANVYFKEEDAKEIVEGLLSSFAVSGVVKLEAKGLSSKTAIHISQNVSYSRFFERLYAFLEEFEQMQMKYLIGELSESDFLTKLLKIKLEFEEIIRNFENLDNEKLFNDIKTYANMYINYFNDFFDSFFQSTKKESLICGLKYNFIKLKVDMFNNLQ